MALALSLFPRFEFLALIFQLFLSVVFGVVVYTIAVSILWRTSGSFEGAETYLLEQLRIKGRFLRKTLHK